MDVIRDVIDQISIQKVIMTIILFVICMVAVKVILILFDKFIKRTKIDVLVCKILRIVMKLFLLYTVIIIVLSSLGVSVSSLIAALSVIGVAFSLAIQDFLSNVFGGLQIISNHPFAVGDYVEAAGVSGTVREVGLFYTKLDTPDKKLVQVPNSKIVNDSIINYTNSPVRRIEFLIATSYDDDVEKVRTILNQLLCDHPMVIKEEDDKKPTVHVKEFRDNDILYVARAWSENKDYWTVYFDIMDSVKPIFDKNGISFSYPHVNVHMIGKEENTGEK